MDKKKILEAAQRDLDEAAQRGLNEDFGHKNEDTSLSIPAEFTCLMTDCAKSDQFRTKEWRGKLSPDQKLKLFEACHECNIFKIENRKNALDTYKARLERENKENEVSDLLKQKREARRNDERKSQTALNANKNLKESLQLSLDHDFGFRLNEKGLDIKEARERDKREAQLAELDEIGKKLDKGIAWCEKQLAGPDRIQQLRESGALKEDAASDIDIDISCVDLKEARFNDDSGALENVILIESGTNKEKRRHYPESTIREAAPHFRSLKMYINHPTKTEEKERPERSLKDWVSTIVESLYAGGKVLAKVAVHDPWLKERLKDPVARKQIGLSILTGGRSRIGNIDGQEMEIVEKIVFARKSGPVSVDWVTEAGARGRVA